MEIDWSCSMVRELKQNMMVHRRGSTQNQDVSLSTIIISITPGFQPVIMAAETYMRLC